MTRLTNCAACSLAIPQSQALRFFYDQCQRRMMAAWSLWVAACTQQGDSLLHALDAGYRQLMEAKALLSVSCPPDPASSAELDAGDAQPVRDCATEALESLPEGEQIEAAVESSCTSLQEYVRLCEVSAVSSVSELLSGLSDDSSCGSDSPKAKVPLPGLLAAAAEWFFFQRRSQL